MYKIDKNIPIYDGDKCQIYLTMKKLKINESFLVPKARRTNALYKKILANSARIQRNLGKKFKTKTREGGIRIWRIQ